VNRGEILGSAIDLVCLNAIHVHRDFHDLPLISVQERFSAIIGTVAIYGGRLARIGPCSTWGALGARPALRARPWWVGAPVFAMSDAQVRVLWLVLYSVNGLDGVRDIGEVDKCTIPIVTEINSTSKRKKDKK